MENVIIFSTDDQSIHGLKKFLRHLDNFKVLGKFKSTPVSAFGAYKGKLEHSFIMTEEDFNNHIKPYSFVDNQESILRIVTDNKGRMLGTLVFSDGTSKSIGRIVETSPQDAVKRDSWTYRQDLDKYWVADEAS